MNRTEKLKLLANYYWDCNCFLAYDRVCKLLTKIDGIKR